MRAPLDNSLGDRADRAVARRLGRFLLLSPLATVPLTLLLAVPWLDATVTLENRTFGDVVLLHLPGLVNVYPAWRVAARWVHQRRLGRPALALAAVGLLTYLVPNAVWLLVVESWHRTPPLVSDPRVVVVVAAQSGMHSLILWVLLLTIYHGLDDRAARPAPYG